MHTNTGTGTRPGTVPVLVPGIPSLLTDFKISNFVTFSYSGSMKDYIEGFFTSYKKKKKSVFQP
jgi:hypothetical protein